MFLLTILQWQKRDQHGLGELLIWHSLSQMNRKIPTYTYEPQIHTTSRTPPAQNIIFQMYSHAQDSKHPSRIISTICSPSAMSIAMSEAQWCDIAMQLYRLFGVFIRRDNRLLSECIYIYVCMNIYECSDKANNFDAILNGQQVLYIYTYVSL